MPLRYDESLALLRDLKLAALTIGARLYVDQLASTPTSEAWPIERKRASLRRARRRALRLAGLGWVRMGVPRSLVRLYAELLLLAFERPLARVDKPGNRE